MKLYDVGSYIVGPMKSFNRDSNGVKLTIIALYDPFELLQEAMWEV